jgi:hypothetical protein
MRPQSPRCCSNENDHENDGMMDGTWSRGEPVNRLDQENVWWPPVNHLRKSRKLDPLPVKCLERNFFWFTTVLAAVAHSLQLPHARRTNAGVRPRQVGQRIRPRRSQCAGRCRCAGGTAPAMAAPATWPGNQGMVCIAPTYQFRSHHVLCSAMSCSLPAYGMVPAHSAGKLRAKESCPPPCGPACKWCGLQCRGGAPLPPHRLCEVWATPTHGAPADA